MVNDCDAVGKDKYSKVIVNTPNIVKFEWCHICILFDIFQYPNKNICSSLLKQKHILIFQIIL